MSNGLFFTGVVLKNNRNLLEEEAARQQLAIQQEQLEIQKQDAAERRKENRRKNAPKYKDFGKANIGGFSPAVRNSIDSYIDAVGNNPEDYELKAKLESQVSSDQALLTKIHSDYETKMQELAKGGETLDQANYVVGNDGMYEFERRYNEAVELVNSGKMSAEKATQMYYNNDDQSLYKVTQKGNEYFAWIKDNLKGEVFVDSEGVNKYKGVTGSDKERAYNHFTSRFTPNSKTGTWDNKSDKNAYFNQDVFDNQGDSVNAQELFFMERNEGMPSGELLASLNPKGTYTDSEGVEYQQEYDKDLANEYSRFLAEKVLNPYMPETKLVGVAQDESNIFKDAYEIQDWEKMSSSKNFTENKYGCRS